MIATLRAEDAVYGGYVLSRDDGIVFIRGAIPGEVVEVMVTEKKRDYSMASVTGVIEQSNFRVKPPCPYFEDCGGCQLQFAAYEKQVFMKNHVLSDCMKRIGDIECELSLPIVISDFHYRRRAQFKVSREGKVGFYREGTRDVVPISKCLLLTDEINGILGKLIHMELHGIKEIHVTSADTLMALVKGIGFDESLAEKLVGLGFSTVAFENGDYRGQGHVNLDLCGLRYTVSPWSFFQNNWELNVKVAALIAEKMEPLQGQHVLDLYAGAGNFSLPLAADGAAVVAVEENEYSIRDGERNVSMNDLRNFTFIKGQADSAKIKGDFSAAILNPPRPGLSGVTVERVLKFSPGRIAYVSCNPSTFARDLKKFKGEYEVDSIRMIDFFPHTYHVESLAFLSKRSG